MVKVKLLEDLTSVIREDTQDLLLQLSIQKTDNGEQKYRSADIYKMRLPNSSEAKKKVPYVIIQVTGGVDRQTPGQRQESYADVRLVCAVYNIDEGEGMLDLLNLTERIRIGLEKRVIIGQQFELDLSQQMKVDLYDDVIAPYYAGELTMRFRIPAIQREDIRTWL